MGNEVNKKVILSDDELMQVVGGTRTISDSGSRCSKLGLDVCNNYTDCVVRGNACRPKDPDSSTGSKNTKSHRFVKII